jgi:hypothetical protein
MRVWVVIFEHKHGVDAWPTLHCPTIEEVKEGLRKEGSWDDDDDKDDRNYIEVRGPWEARGGGPLALREG